MLLLTWCVSRIGKQDSSRWLATLPIRRAISAPPFLLNRREVMHFRPRRSTRMEFLRANKTKYARSRGAKWEVGGGICKR